MKIGVFRNYKLENQVLKYENYKLMKSLKEIKKLTDKIEIKNTINDEATKIIFELKRGTKQEALKTLQLIKIQLHDIEIDS
jgi:hypothetical protein